MAPAKATLALTLAATSVFWMSARAQLPAVPVPAENPVTEAKRVLGKMLFWDEQLSSDDSVACGTCHLPSSGGGDPRVGRFPGNDKGSIDDVWGSPGVVHMNAAGEPLEHPVFGYEPQITDRASPSNFAAAPWAEEIFWDGRAPSEFLDPLTGEVAIPSGGALENQALEPLLNPVEMAHPGRSWADVTEKVGRIRPLALARDIPEDVAGALESVPDYPALFEAAFGSPEITPVRIAYALATYQRTLVADQTPWDRYMAGDEGAMSEQETNGWRIFQRLHCVNCHEPPLFTNNDFFNIGLRLVRFDAGRQNVTQDPEDGGEMRVPSLRNAGLRSRFMHTGEFRYLTEAITFYNNPPALPGQDEIPGIGTYSFSLTDFETSYIAAFIRSALTDPRVAGELFPFDRPTLNGENPR